MDWWHYKLFKLGYPTLKVFKVYEGDCKNDEISGGKWSFPWQEEQQ